MTADRWPTKLLSVTSLQLDAKNPRLGRETSSGAPSEIIQYLFEHDKALEVAESIAFWGYFPNEPLLAIKDNDLYIVVEGNRRLAALKALREPRLLEGSFMGKVERLSKRITSPEAISKVPVTIAPSRRATDQQIVGRHIGTPVLAWRPENKASFILDKLSEGYSSDELRDDFHFSSSDIQQARQIRAIAEMARSLDLPNEIKVKLDNPRANIFTTIKRVFDSSEGRKYLMIAPDPEHGLRGVTTKEEFLRGFTRLVTDIALRKQSSRTLNRSDDIQAYFENWDPKDRPAKKRGSFVPSDIIKGKSVASPAIKLKTTLPKKSKQLSKTVLPKDFKVRHGSERLIDIRRELTKLKREEYPNAGTVMIRVFFELAVYDYLERTKDLESIAAKLKGKNVLPQNGVPTMRQLVPEIIKIAKKNLGSKAEGVAKAITYNRNAPFTLSDLNSFVHQASALPCGRDILQYWLRTEPLFRMMLEEDLENSKE